MYELIHAERAHISVALACRALEVSRSGYYAWRRFNLSSHVSN
jgi:hypothetical protein